MNLKRITCLFSALCITLSLSTNVIALPTGDFNGDNIVDTTDLDEIIKNYNTKNTKYDLNGDGLVDIHDITYLQRNLSKEAISTEYKGALGITKDYILYLRPESNATAKSDIMIPVGTMLDIYARVGNFYKVSYVNDEGKRLDGYITRYVDIIKDDDKNSFLGTLSEKYESNGDPGCISKGTGDYGGKSYGAWQLSSKMGSVDSFLIWLKDVNKSFYETLNAARIMDNLGPNNFGDNFDSAWTNIASFHYDEFLKIQQDYIKLKYYDELVKRLDKIGSYEKLLEKYSTRNVLWSLSVQHGASGAQRLIQNANARPEPKDFIEDAYTERNKVETYFPNSPTLHNSLKNRFNNEKADALRILELENLLDKDNQNTSS